MKPKTKQELSDLSDYLWALSQEEMKREQEKSPKKTINKVMSNKVTATPNKKHENKEHKPEQTTLRRLTINEVFNHLIIDDGITSTPIDESVLADKEIIDADSFDPDNMGEILKLLTMFLVTLCHPTAIWKIEEFAGEVEGVSEPIGNTTYKFFYDEDFVYGYIIDKSFYKKLEDLINGKSDDVILTYYISIIKQRTNPHSVFYADKEYIKRFRKEVAGKDTKEFIYEFFKECGELKTSNKDLLEVIPNIDEIQASAADFIRYVRKETVFDNFTTEISEEWDDEEVEDDTVDDVKEVEDDTVEEVEEVEDDTVEEVEDDTVEEVEDMGDVNIDDIDNMVINVISKNS